MKAQFKYTFLEGYYARRGVFAVIFLMNLVFMILGSLGLLPVAAKITAVALSGTAIGVMSIVNVISNVGIIRRMFAAPRAYLYALTPAPRRKTLFASVISMLAMDIATTAVAIAGVIYLSLLLAGSFIGGGFWEMVRSNIGLTEILTILAYSALLIAAYLLVTMIIVFIVTMRKSVFYQKHAGGILTALAAVGTVYVVTLTNILLAPFGTVSRWGIHFTITLGGTGQIMYVLLTFIQAAALFVITSKLMERKINI